MNKNIYVSLNHKKIRITRYFTVLLVMSFLNVKATGYAQQITLDRDNVALEDVLDEIYKQTNYQVVYQYEAIKGAQKVSLHVKEEPLEKVLAQIFKDRPVDYRIEDKAIILTKKRSSAVTAANELEADVPPIEVKGTVKDEQGEPLIGVSIKVADGGGAVTGVDGSFALTAEEDAVLIVSYLGFETQEVPVNGQTQIDIVLKEAVSELSQVVVIGYGSTTKGDLTGSVSTAPIEEMQKAPVPNIVDAMQGRLAGVVVSSPSAQPGENSNIVIRGNNSITQANSPLYVVDGFPMEDFNANNLNPEEIESINILKDASATAIYGARGANGVIIIETKGGKEGPPVVTFNASVGFQDVIKRMELMSPHDFVEYQLEYNPGDPTVTGTAPYIYLRNGDLKSYLDTPAIDWQDEMYRSAMIQNYNLAVRGGSEKTKYSFTGNVFDQDGVIINSGYKRYQGRIKLDQEISSKIKGGINAYYAFLDQNGISPSFASKEGASSTSTMMYSVWGYRPFGDLLEQAFDPNINSSNDYRFNPVLDQQNIVRTNSWNRIDARAYIDFKIIPELTLRVTGGIFNDIREAVSFNDTLTHFGNSKLSSDGINGETNTYRTTSWVNENTLTYKKIFDDVHKFEAVAGITEQKRTVRINGARAIHLPEQATGVNWLASGTPNRLQSSSTSNTMTSFLGRINYGYKSKYLATVSFRADGSSKFAPWNHWSYFPSGALAWNVGNEDFVKEIDWISNAKIRASYGVTGNNRVGDFDYLSQFNTFSGLRGYTFGGNIVHGMIPSQLGNVDLKWETTSQTDLGFEIGFLQERIALTLDLYRKKTKDLLLNSRIPTSFGYKSIFKNIGSVLNEGIEISVNTRNVETEDFSWSTSFNIAFNKNKVTGLAEGQYAMTDLFAPFDNNVKDVSAFIARVGQPMGMMYGPIWDGIYQYEDFDQLSNGEYLLRNDVSTNGNPRSTIQPGDIKYKDLNGDGTVNNKDFTLIGRGLPKHTGGFTNNFSYKNFDLSVFFQWSYGNDKLNANRLVFEGNMLNKQDLNQFASYKNRWTPDHPSNTLYRAHGEGPLGNMFSSRIIEDGSYIRLKTLSLGYNFPKSMLETWNISNLRVYMSAQNLITWTKYEGMDPEVSIYDNVLTPGVDFSSYPRARIVTFGLNVTF